MDRIIDSLKAAGLDHRKARNKAKEILQETKRPFSREIPPQIASIYQSNDKQFFENYVTNTEAIALLAQVPYFSGSSSSRFDSWIKHFDSIMDTANWPEERKIKLLCSKLTNSASNCVENFKINHPHDAKSYEKLKMALHKRFHGNESRHHYAKQFKSCKRLPGESVIEYADRISILFNHAHPMDKDEKNPSGKTIALREELLKDYFIDGLSLDLRSRVRHKTFECFDKLVELTNTFAMNYDDDKEERSQMRETINAINGRPAPSNVLNAECIANIIKSTVEEITKNTSAEIAVMM